MSRSRILAVDDDPLNLTILDSVLSEEFDVRMTASGEEALAAATEFQPDLVLLDIVMPGIDGYETCRRLRKSPELRLTKIMLVSSKASVQERIKGYEAGADDYVTKPFEHMELLAKVRVFLRLKSVEEMDRLKTDFLTLLGHELRTPLTGILGAVDLVLADVPSADRKTQELLSIINQSAHRLQYMVERTMALVAFKSGTIQSEMLMLDPGYCIQEIVSKWELEVHGEKGRIEFVATPSTHVECDAPSLKLVVECLLDYALNKSPSGEKIRIETAFADDWFTLTVTDRRPPMDKEAIELALHAYSVEDVAHHGGELRLDLPVALELVRRMGGTLGMKSDATHGTNVSVSIPIRSAEAPPDEDILKRSA